MIRNWTTRRVLTLGAVGLAALVAGGAALAGGALGGDDEREAYLDGVAERLDVTPEALREAMQGALAERLDAAVAAGRLTQAEADRLKERAEQNGGLPFLGRHHGHHGPKGDRRALMDAAASYLGLSAAELRTAKMEGKSLAQIARERGKTAAGLKAAMLAAAKRSLAERVEAGDLTQAQADATAERLEARLDDLVERTGRPFGRRPASAPEPGAGAAWS